MDARLSWFVCKLYNSLSAGHTPREFVNGLPISGGVSKKTALYDITDALSRLLKEPRKWLDLRHPNSSRTLAYILDSVQYCEALLVNVYKEDSKKVERFIVRSYKSLQ